jgi:hypothetical protein
MKGMGKECGRRKEMKESEGLKQKRNHSLLNFSELFALVLCNVQVQIAVYKQNVPYLLRVPLLRN